MEQAPPRYKQGVNDKNKTTEPFPFVTSSSHPSRNPHNQGPSSPPYQFQVPTGHAAFRLLFHDSVIRAAYGDAAAASSGSIIIADGTDCKPSGSVVRLLESVPNCDERVVLIVGPDDGNHKGERAAAACSAAQDALLRVHNKLSGVERRLQEEQKDKGSGVESTTKGIVRCRMLAPTNLINALMGRKGAVIQDIERRTGTRITVFPFRSLPLCAAPADELIQISGTSLAVGNALIDVSYCLQVENRKVYLANVNCGATSPLADVKDQQTTRCSVSPKSPFNIGTPNYSVPGSDKRKYHVSTSDKDTTPSPGNPACSSNPSSPGSAILEEIAFRLLCSNDAIGGILGRGASIVKAMQEETGASIWVSPPTPHCNERVVTIKSSENPHSNISPAQDAVIQVFIRSVEVGIGNGSGPYVDNTRTVTARLLVPCKKTECIVGARGSIVSEIRRKTSTHIIVISGNLVPACASENDEVVKVSGLFNNVLDALLDITTRLRQDIFSNKNLMDNSGVKFHSARNSGSYKTAERTHGQSHNANHHDTVTDGMNHLRLNNAVYNPSFPRKWEPKNAFAGNQRRMSNQARDLAISQEKEVQRGTMSFPVKNMTLQISVPADLIREIYGEGGTNINQIKERLYSSEFKRFIFYIYSYVILEDIRC